MTTIKVQKRKTKAQGKIYSQYWIALPKVIFESMRKDKGDSLEGFIERGDIVLRKQ
jgi:hypothetical protein